MPIVNNTDDDDDRLSRLQKLIMAMLWVVANDPQAHDTTRREFNQHIYKLYFGEESQSARSSLSRAFRGLEDLRYIIRGKGRWLLGNFPEDGGALGVAVAMCEHVDWQRRLEKAKRYLTEYAADGLPWPSKRQSNHKS